MTFSKEEIVEVMRNTGIVPLFTHDNAADAEQVIEAAYKGGVRAFEFTNRRPNSFEIFSHLVRERKKFPDLMLGIGTVMDGATTKKIYRCRCRLHYFSDPEAGDGESMR